MFFVGKTLNLKMLQMAFYQELWTVKINISNYKLLLCNEPSSVIEAKFPKIKKYLTFFKVLQNNQLSMAEWFPTSYFSWRLSAFHWDSYSCN